jgi:hypothetical protein
MFQIAYEYQEPWPKEGVLRLEARFDGEIKVSPTVARHRASGFLAGHVTMMVLAGEPILVLNDPPVWRIPACLHLPDWGEVATIGVLDVDALTGEVIPPSSKQITMMQHRANDLAARLALPPVPAG